MTSTFFLERKIPFVTRWKLQRKQTNFRYHFDPTFFALIVGNLESHLIPSKILQRKFNTVSMMIYLITNNLLMFTTAVYFFIANITFRILEGKKNLTKIFELVNFLRENVSESRLVVVIKIKKK